MPVSEIKYSKLKYFCTMGDLKDNYHLGSRLEENISNTDKKLIFSMCKKLCKLTKRKKILRKTGRGHEDTS